MSFPNHISSATTTRHLARLASLLAGVVTVLVLTSLGAGADAGQDPGWVAEPGAAVGHVPASATGTEVVPTPAIGDLPPPPDGDTPISHLPGTAQTGSASDLELVGTGSELAPGDPTRTGTTGSGAVPAPLTAAAPSPAPAPGGEVLGGEAVTTGGSAPPPPSSSDGAIDTQVPVLDGPGPTSDGEARGDVVPVPDPAPGSGATGGAGPGADSTPAPSADAGSGSNAGAGSAPGTNVGSGSNDGSGSGIGPGSAPGGGRSTGAPDPKPVPTSPATTTGADPFDSLDVPGVGVVTAPADVRTAPPVPAAPPAPPVSLDLAAATPAVDSARPPRSFLEASASEAGAHLAPRPQPTAPRPTAQLAPTRAHGDVDDDPSAEDSTSRSARGATSHTDRAEQPTRPASSPSPRLPEQRGSASSGSLGSLFSGGGGINSVLDVHHLYALTAAGIALMLARGLTMTHTASWKSLVVTTCAERPG